MSDLMLVPGEMISWDVGCSFISRANGSFKYCPDKMVGGLLLVYN